MSESVKKFESGLPGDIPPNEWKFLEAIRGFEGNMEFILDEKNLVTVDGICDELYNAGLKVIHELASAEEPSVYAVIPFNPLDIVDLEIGKRVESEVRGRIVKSWESIFVTEVRKRRDQYNGLVVKIKIQYGLIEVGDQPKVRGVLFIKKIT